MTALEEQLYISRVRDFYKDLLGFGGVNLFLLGVWAFLSPSWYFWPGWVMIGWGMLLGRRAMGLGLWSCKTTQLSLGFMSPEWEKKQLAKLRAQEGVPPCGMPTAGKNPSGGALSSPSPSATSASSKSFVIEDSPSSEGTSSQSSMGGGSAE